jgi:hypothetical protein
VELGIFPVVDLTLPAPSDSPSLLLAHLSFSCHYSLTTISAMKHLLLTTIAAVVLVGCGNPEAEKE